MNPLLMRAVVEALLFFELCDDDVLDPKVAVAQLEHLAQFIKRMTLEDRMAFARYTTELGLAEHRAHREHDVIVVVGFRLVELIDHPVFGWVAGKAQRLGCLLVFGAGSACAGNSSSEQRHATQHPASAGIHVDVPFPPRWHG